jgi:hypothetical protein
LPAALLGAITPAPPPGAVRWRLLSDNAYYRGASLPTGVAYRWEHPASNPADTSGRRLLDGDRPSNWNTTTGWNHRDNAVVFDFQKPFRFTVAEFCFEQALPDFVEIQVPKDATAGTAGVWRTVARIETPAEGWNRVQFPDAPPTRHLRVFVKLKQWGVYFREAQFYGTPPEEYETPTPPPVPLTRSGRPLIANDGMPGMSIVVDTPESLDARYAACILRDTIETMTGAALPVFAPDEKPSGPRLILGSGALAREAGVTVPQSDLPGTERYRIFTKGHDLVLAGNDGGDFRGTTHAVYDLLQRLGCGWNGTDPLYHVIPKQATLALPVLDVDESPDFDMRRIGFIRDHVLQDAWRLPGFEVRANHVLGRLVRDELREEHPDWFGRDQPCLTHPEVRDHIAKQFRQRLDAAPGRFLSLSIGQNDTPGFCRCDRCRAAGNNSSCYIQFANAIADALRETHAGRFQLGFLAYWVTHAPPDPMVVARPEIVVRIVNEGNHTKPLDMPVHPEEAQRSRSNLRERNAIDGWLGSGALQGVYEWWIPGCSDKNWRRVPWYSGETALRNLRYWKGKGLRYINYETGYEADDGFPLRWPLYYIAARGTWDCDLTSTQIMTEACNRLFGQAAPPMIRFYATLEAAMLKTPHAAGNWHLPSPELIYTPEAEMRATGYLEEAARLSGTPEETARIASEHAMWNRARATLAALRAEVKSGGGYPVRLGDETRIWTAADIASETLCDIFGLPRGTPLTAVETDGQIRRVLPADHFDLRTGITFRLAETNNEAD